MFKRLHISIDGGESNIYPNTPIDIDGDGVVDSGKQMDLNGDGIIEMGEENYYETPPDEYTYFVDVFVVVDEDFKLYYERWWNSDLWEDISIEAINEAGKYFLNTYDVKLNISQIYDGWNSENNIRKIGYLLEEVEIETNWIGSNNGTDNHNSDILVAFTGQDPQLLSKLLGDYAGIAHPSSSSVINRIPPADFSNLVQHEISHLFGAPDHYDGRFCIMDKTWPWPVGKGQINGNIWTTHEWDNECFNIIESNKSEVSQFSEGGDYDINN